MADAGVAGQMQQMPDQTQAQPQKCAVCETNCEDPRMLDCLHVFCLTCLQEVRPTEKNEKMIIVCPVCQRETTEPQGGLDMLRKGTHTGKTVTSQELPSQELHTIICQACPEEHVAVFRCLDCDYFLCKACQNAHQKFPSLKHHRIANLTEFGSEDIVCKREFENSVPKCEKHPEQDICFYCNSCDVLICKTCTIFDHKQSMHAHECIDEALSKCRQEINDATSKTKECIQAFNSNRVSLKHSRNRLDKMLAKTKNQISLEAEKAIAKIRNMEKQLHTEVQNIALRRDKEFAYAATAELTICKVNKVMTTASSYKILESKTELLHALKTQAKLHKSLNINHEKSFLGFKESQDAGSLGTVLQEERWALETEFTVAEGGYLAVNSMSNMIVAGSSKLITLTSKGMVLSTKTYKPHGSTADMDESIDIQNPTGLAVNSDDQLIILYGPAVKTFNQEYKLLHQFTPGTESSGTPTCLAVGDNDLIAVGYKDSEEIALHKPDGSLIRTLSAPLLDRNLTICNCRLIYTNTSKCMLMAVDFWGKKLFTVKTNNGPSSLCCDEAGDIYVAVVRSPTVPSSSGGFSFGAAQPQTMRHQGNGLFKLPAASPQGFKFVTPAVPTVKNPFEGTLLYDNENGIHVKASTYLSSAAQSSIAFTPAGRLVVAENGSNIKLYTNV